MKIRSVGAEVLHADRRKDMMKTSFAILRKRLDILKC